jgi:HlyD family secretion protein
MERTIYTLVDGKPQPVTVKLGISDGIFTEALEGLKEGDQVITGTAVTQVPATAPQGSNPLSGGRRRF